MKALGYVDEYIVICTNIVRSNGLVDLISNDDNLNIVSQC